VRYMAIWISVGWEIAVYRVEENSGAVEEGATLQQLCLETALSWLAHELEADSSTVFGKEEVTDFSSEL